MKGGWGYLLLVVLTAAITLGAVRSCDGRKLEQLRKETEAERAKRETLANSADSALRVADSAEARAAAHRSEADRAEARTRAAERARHAAVAALEVARDQLAAAAPPPDTLRDQVIAAQAAVITALEDEVRTLRGELVPLRATLAEQLEQIAALRASRHLTQSALLLAEASIAALERSIARLPSDPCLVRWPTCVTLTAGATVSTEGAGIGATIGIPIRP